MPTKGECVGQDNECSLIQPGHNGSKYALSTRKQTEGSHGIDQKLDMDCFSVNTTYEINARTKLVNYNDTLVDCDPYNQFQGQPQYCPTILLQNPDNGRVRVRAAATAGFSDDEDGWNHIYGLVVSSL